MYEGFKDNPEWFVQRLSIADTHALSYEQIEATKKEYWATYGPEAGQNLFDQEYMCSFEAAVLGSYYGPDLRRLEESGRMRNVVVDPTIEVHTAWDLGIDDSTAIWFWQAVGSEVRLVDYLEDNGRSLEYYVREIKGRGYNYGRHIFPHDAMVRELGTGKTRSELAESMGLRGIEIAPKLSVEDGINAARLLLARCWFDGAKCGRGVEALKSYRQKIDEKRQISTGPLHDWSSHAADAFRYLAVSANGPRLQQQPLRLVNRRVA
jgi:hypothetical protein